MCGISGLLHFPDKYKLENTVRCMGQALSHRGPDDSGVWFDPAYGLALGHQRLAVIDLSPAGSQPMHSPDHRYVMVFNGEIYNHRSLRKKLDSIRHIHWQGHSDTETLLAAFCEWGIESTLEQCVGMFAIALWDKQRRQLKLIRDRAGEKPLYYGQIGSCFAFASELKALKAIPDFNPLLSRKALNSYMHYGYIPAPDTIYQGIHKLEPGTILTFDHVRHAGLLAPDIQHWWSFRSVALHGQKYVIHDKAEALERLEQQLTESISLQSCADVPVGAFLSGGIDSSIVVSLLQQHSNQTVKTFTVGFEQNSYNEAQHAEAVAGHLKTEHTGIYVTGSEAREVIPLLARIYDEPFADTSQIPTYLIAKHARKQVTVALSGDAGDELLGGYSSYIHSRKIWAKLSLLPSPLRNTLGKMLTALPPAQWNRLAQRLNNTNFSGNNLHKLATGLTGSENLQSFFTQLGIRGGMSDSLVLNEKLFQPKELPASYWKELDAEHTMMLSDCENGLPDDILCKVDRAAMAMSLETRIPFLDHRVIELAWRIPLSMKINQGQGKSILRELLYQYVPRTLVERPKQGFNVPIENWLHSELRDWAEDLLDENSLRQAGYLDAVKVHQLWQQFLSGKRANQQQIWAILMFQSWFRHWHS